MSDDRLTIRVSGTDDLIPVASFLSVVSNTLEILRDIDAVVSHHREGTLDWRIADVSLSSPLQLTIVAEGEAETDSGREVLTVFTDSLRRIQEGTDRAPAYWTVEALERARNLTPITDNGIAEISFVTPWAAPVTPSADLRARVDRLLPREHEELGTVVGTLETLSKHEGATFRIWDVLTKAGVLCVIPPEMLPQAHEAFGKRVAVRGRIRYRADGKPKRITVYSAQDLRPLREQSELPQARDLEAINITDGVDPSEYVRRLRDAS